MKSEDICYLEEKLWKTQHIKKRRHHFAKKGLHGQSYGFSSSHVWIWELDHKESWVPKYLCFWTVVEKTLESPLDCKEIKSVNPKGNLPWIFIGKTDLKLQYVGHLMRRADSFEKTLMLGKIEGWRRREWQDEMVGWHHWLDGHEFEQVPRNGEGQGSLACCSPWCHKKLDRTEWLNNSWV